MSDNATCASSIPEFSQRNGIGESTTYKEIRTGRLVARKVGRRTIITNDDERAWRDNLPRLQAAAAQASEITDVAEAP
jgi:hypothetical protein